MLGVLAVVGIPLLLVFAAILAPAVLGGLARAQRTEMIANGRTISQAVLSTYIGKNFPYAVYVEDEETTAEYLTTLVTDGYLGVDRGFFSGPRMPSGKGPISREAPLRSEENAWRIVTRVWGEDPAVTPLLVTRNFASDTLDERPRLSDEPPFGRQGVVVATVGGSAMFLPADRLDEEWAALVAEHLRDRRILPP